MEYSRWLIVGSAIVFKQNLYTPILLGDKYAIVQYVIIYRQVKHVPCVFRVIACNLGIQYHAFTFIVTIYMYFAIYIRDAVPNNHNKSSSELF